MRILVVGTGGVGSAFAAIAQRRSFFDRITLADLDPSRPQAVVDRLGEHDRFNAARVDASSEESIVSLIRDVKADAVLNATDPRFNPQIFDACLRAGVTYLDMAATLSQPHPERPYEETHVKLGDYQFAQHENWHEAGVRDGSNLVVEGYDFAPSFSVWTTIEECLNPPVVYEKDRGWFTTEPFSEPEVFVFPEGIGPVECVNVEHEEVLLVPRWLDVDRATFKYGLGDEFIDVLKTLHKLGLDRTEKVTVGDVEVSPRDVVAACLPHPAHLGDRMTGKTCAGMWVRGTGKDGQPRSTYLYHVVDNEWSMREYGSQAVVWQTAVNPIVALELIDSGTWSGAGLLGPEAFDAVPFLDLLAGGYESPWGMQEVPEPELASTTS